jgi:hypothetical protein
MRSLQPTDTPAIRNARVNLLRATIAAMADLAALTAEAGANDHYRVNLAIGALGQIAKYDDANPLDIVSAAMEAVADDELASNILERVAAAARRLSRLLNTL